MKKIYKKGDKVEVVKCWGKKIKPIILYWTGQKARLGQPLLQDKDGNLFRVLESDSTHLVNGDVYHV